MKEDMIHLWYDILINMQNGMDRADLINEICNLLSEVGATECRTYIQENYPYDSKTRLLRLTVPSNLSAIDNDGSSTSNWNIHPARSVRVFIRDGFINRYTGEEVVLPAVLRVLSIELPDCFPFQEHWKRGEAHIAYNDLGACTSRAVPVSRGGDNTESNLFTTTMPCVKVKSNFILEELGWSIYPPGDVLEWDGMMDWYIRYLDEINPSLLKRPFFKSWYKAAIAGQKSIRK